MLLQNTSQIEHVIESKSNRLQLTESLHDFFALNPKSHKRNVRFESDMILHDETDRSYSYSLSSIPEESLGLDVTQHRRRSLPDKTSLDATHHHRQEARGQYVQSAEHK
jgi:hypothetical protein